MRARPVPDATGGGAAAAAGLLACWVNGEPVAPDGPAIAPRDRGLTLGDGVFETLPVYRGRVFRLDRHLDRLRRGLAALQIPERPELRGWVLEAARRAAGEPASIRLTVTRGPGAAGVAPPAEATPTVVVTLTSLPAFSDDVYRAGLSAEIASGRRNARAMTAGLKTLAYADAVAALIEARRAGADEALFLDTDDHCSEATSSNLFVWTGGELVTPPVSCGALPGITRAAVLEVASRLAIPASERVCDVPALLGAGEAFLTSSLRGIAPLVRVGARPIGSGAPGDVTRRVASAYAALVVEECGRP
jgi:branched-chain amino acid aminotransferase